ncbi:MAG: hypothetical protein ABSB77_25780 [Xanthobacteraceae bacterium]|jgi:hypothetical protein
MADDPPTPIDLDRVVGWPPDGHSVGSVAHVHAFGQIALTAAMLEETLILLLIQRLPMPENISGPLVHKLNNRERSDWYKGLVDAQETDREILERLGSAVLAFDICMDNRNTLVHALYEGTDVATAIMKLSKRARNDPLREVKMQLPLSELRNIAEEMGTTLNFMLDMFKVNRWRKWAERQTPMPPQPEPFPEIPPRPNRLTMSPPQANAGGEGQS